MFSFPDCLLFSPYNFSCFPFKRWWFINPIGIFLHFFKPVTCCSENCFRTFAFYMSFTGYHLHQSIKALRCKIWYQTDTQIAADQVMAEFNKITSCIWYAKKRNRFWFSIRFREIWKFLLFGNYFIFDCKQLSYEYRKLICYKMDLSIKYNVQELWNLLMFEWIINLFDRFWISRCAFWLHTIPNPWITREEWVQKI